MQKKTEWSFWNDDDQTTERNQAFQILLGGIISSHKIFTDNKLSYSLEQQNKTRWLLHTYFLIKDTIEEYNWCGVK